MLSTLKIRNAKTDGRPCKLSDSGGLYLLVQPNGSKLWRYKFRINGTEGVMALGAFPEIGLAEARGLHADARKVVAQGINPIQAKKDERIVQAQEQLERIKGAFGSVVADWKAATDADLRPSTQRQRKREIDNDLLPTLKNRPIGGISRLELTALLKKIELRAPEVARNIRNYMWGVFEYAIDSGLIDSNPVPPGRVMKKRNQKNHPALSEEQLGVFLRTLDAATTINEETRIAMLLVLLTACRKAEIIEGCWNEIDLDGGQWEIPAARMKAKRSHWIPLSPQAIALLTRLRVLVPGDREHLFPNRLDPRRPMANRSLNALMERSGFSGEGTPHGMRAAFSTYFNRIGASVDVIEHCLAHVPANAVRAAYNRHVYQDERRAMLRQWADYLDHLRREDTKSDAKPIESDGREISSVVTVVNNGRRVNRSRSTTVRTKSSLSGAASEPSGRRRRDHSKSLSESSTATGFKEVST